MFLSFCVLDDSFRFSKKLRFWVFLVRPTVVSVLLSVSVERCFVSRMRDFSFFFSLGHFVGIHNEEQQVKFLELIANQTTPALVAEKTCSLTDAGADTGNSSLKVYTFFTRSFLRPRWSVMFLWSYCPLSIHVDEWRPLQWDVRLLWVHLFLFSKRSAKASQLRLVTFFDRPGDLQTALELMHFVMVLLKYLCIDAKPKRLELG